MKPVLSIITISYKDPTGLSRTIESLRPLLKSDLAWEHIIVDSSLPDNATLIQSLPKTWPLTHIPCPPRGIYAAINRGVESARGTFVQLLHGGDRLRDPGALVSLAKLIADDTDVDVLCAGAALHNKGELTYVHPAPRSWLRGLLGINRFCHQAMLYRRSKLEKVGQFSEDFPVAADYEHHFRAYLRKLKYRADTSVLVDYDTGGTSSNVRQALAEFRAVQISLRRDLVAPLNWANTCIWWFEEKRIRMFKMLGKSVLGEPLRRLWHNWKRR